jgi:hypothetical protein
MYEVKSSRLYKHCNTCCTNSHFYSVLVHSRRTGVVEGSRTKPGLVFLAGEYNVPFSSGSLALYKHSATITTR